MHAYCRHPHGGLLAPRTMTRRGLIRELRFDRGVVGAITAVPSAVNSARRALGAPVRRNGSLQAGALSSPISRQCAAIQDMPSARPAAEIAGRSRRPPCSSVTPARPDPAPVSRSIRTLRVGIRIVPLNACRKAELIGLSIASATKARKLTPQGDTNGRSDTDRRRVRLHHRRRGLGRLRAGEPALGRSEQPRAAARSRRPRQLDLVSHPGRLPVRDRQSALRLDVQDRSRCRASTAAR